LPVACTSGDFRSDPSTPTSTTLAPEVTVRATVGMFLASAQLVILAQRVSDVGNVLVAANTEVVRSSGAPASVSDLVEGAPIEVTGRPATPGSLVARRIVLL
jgi:hypothetical protein